MACPKHNLERTHLAYPMNSPLGHPTKSEATLEVRDRSSFLMTMIMAMMMTMIHFPAPAGHTGAEALHEVSL